MSVSWVRHSNLMVQVHVQEFDSAQEDWDVDTLDSDKTTAWLLPKGILSPEIVAQFEYDPAEDEERVRFRAPVTRFDFKLVHTEDHNFISSLYSPFRGGEYIDRTAQDVFGDCLPILREMALGDIKREREFNSEDPEDPALYCNSASFLGVFELTTWYVTPRWASDECEWIRDIVSQTLRVLGRIDTRRLSGCTLPPDGESAWRDWDVVHVGNWKHPEFDD